jgi:hypothetical protein
MHSHTGGFDAGGCAAGQEAGGGKATSVKIRCVAPLLRFLKKSARKRRHTLRNIFETRERLNLFIGEADELVQSALNVLKFLLFLCER